MLFWGTRSWLPWASNNNQKSGYRKIINIFRANQNSTILKTLHRYNRVLIFYQNYIPRLAEGLTPFCKLLKQTDAKAKIPITVDVVTEFTKLIGVLDRCCRPVLCQPLSGKQQLITTDTSFQASSYAVLTEDDPKQNYTSTRKTYAPIAPGLRTYTPSQIEFSIKANF